MKYKPYLFLIEAMGIIQRFTEARPIIRKVLFLISIFFVILFTYLSLESLEITFSDAFIWLIVIDLLFLSPTAILLSAIGVRLQAKLLERDLKTITAIKACTIGTVGNILPVPAGMLAHGHALTRTGLTYIQSSQSTIGTAIIWLSLGLFSIGVSLLRHYPTAYIAVLFITAALFIFSGLHLIARSQDMSVYAFRIIFGICCVQLTRLILLAFRVWVVFFALGEVVSIEEAFAIAGATIAGLVISITPAGLGISEVLAMGISTLINLTPELSFIVVFLVRILGLASAGMILSGLMLLPKGNKI